MHHSSDGEDTLEAQLVKAQMKDFHAGLAHGGASKSQVHIFLVLGKMTALAEVGVPSYIPEITETCSMLSV